MGQTSYSLEERMLLKQNMTSGDGINEELRIEDTFLVLELSVNSKAFY